MHLKNANRGSRRRKLWAIFLIVGVYLLVASPFAWQSIKPVEAYEFGASLGNVAKSVGLTRSVNQPPVALPTLIGRIIYYALSLVGVVFLILTIIAGLKWMLAGGNEEAVSKAKRALLDASLGVLVVLAAYAITYFIVTVIS